MVYGIPHLRRAAAELSSVDGQPPPRDTLGRAVQEVWAASAYWTYWPPSLREPADDLIELLTRYGPISAASERTTDADAKRAVALIRGLADEAERLVGGGVA